MPRPAGPAPGRAWPFTGRDGEMRAVMSALERDGVVVVAGAAGVGKSRLARELVARVATDESVALATASTSSREIPLGAFAPWLNAEPEVAADGAVSALARVGAALRAGGERTLLLVDDAHMLDGVSATLVHQLAVEHVVRLVLTVRTGEPCPDAITAIWKDGLGERIEVESLAPEATAALLGAALGGPLDAQGQRRMHDTTQGNVLWMRHLVDGERAANRLVAVDGHWEWHGPVGLSPALEHLLVARIGALDEGERRVLDLVALGEPLGLGLLTGLTTDADVERVAERELVTVVAEGARWEVHLAHPLYGEVTRAHLSPPRARRLRGEISGAIRATGARRVGDDLRRAVLDLDSDAPPDATLLLLAAEQAMNLTDFALAERLFRAAADAGAGFDARLGLGVLLGWMLRAEEAETALADAIAAATTDHDRARATICRAYLLMFILDRGDDARALLDREGVDADGEPLPEALAFRATLLVGCGDVVKGVETATSVIDGHDASPQATTWASWAASYGTAFAGGNGAQVRELVVRGMDAARRAPELGAMLGNIGFAEILEAGLSGTLEAPAARLAWVDGLPGQHGATWSALYHGRLALEAGHAATAARLIESILPSFPGHGGGWTSWFHAMIAQARAQLGDVEGAAASLRDAERSRHPELRADDGDLALARVWLEAARGSEPEAVAAARRLSVLAASRGQAALEMVARHAAVRVGDRDQEAPLQALADSLGTPRARASAAHATGLVARDPHALLAAADGLEACGLLLAAADAASHAAGAARDRGQLTLATEAADRASALAERCGGATTPALERARAPLPVSSREREVAVLAAEGLSNRQIAARLHVSVRTVESHIYRACTRLGLADRAALAAAVVPSRRS